MKKTFLKSLMLCLGLCMMCMPKAKAAGTVTDAEGIVWYKVYSVKEFKNAVEAKQNIMLMDNLDFTDTDHCSTSHCYFDSFSGRITGRHIDSDGIETVSTIENCSRPLFSSLQGATVKDLLFNNCSDQNNNGCDFALLALTTNNSHIDNVNLLSCTFSKGSASKASLVYEANSTDFANIDILQTSIISNNGIAGLIVGKASNCHFTNCSTNATSGVWCGGGSDYARVGGICGEASSCQFENCLNMALVTSLSDQTGGIVGLGTGVTLTYCTNYGHISNCTQEGFESELVQLRSVWIASISLTVLVTAIASSASLVTSASAAALGLASFAIGGGAFIGLALAFTIYEIASEPDEMGGIAGTIEESSTISQCTNYGMIECFDAFGGGIVGHATGSTITANINQSLVIGDEQTGGIVGHIENCTVRCNINIGAVRANSSWGYIEGEIDGDENHTMFNVFLSSKNETFGQLASFAVTQDNFASGAVALDLNERFGSKVFRQDLGKSIFPTLNPSAPIVKKTITVTDDMLWQKVSNLGDLALALCCPSAKIELTDDIDMSGRVLFCNFSEDMPFTGEIKGNGHTLKNCCYNVYHNGSRVDAGLFSYATGAEFNNFTIENFHIQQVGQSIGLHKYEGLLVANSTNCTFSNISVYNSSIRKNSADDWLEYVGGLVGYSTNDRFISCYTDPFSYFEGYTGVTRDAANIGGIAGAAYQSKFYYCHNAATIISDDDNDGGIVGRLNEGFVEKCLNTGAVTGQDNVGGIVGMGLYSQIYDCVNTGTIAADDGNNNNIGGIVGLLTGNKSVVDYCLGFGNIKNSDTSVAGSIDGHCQNGAVNTTNGTFNSKFRFLLNGDLLDNIKNDADLLSGKFAYEMLGHDGQRFLYQTIDNGGWYTSRPVPIDAAGEIFANTSCGNTDYVYSNIYQNVTSHEPDLDIFGVCKQCGSIHTAPSVVYVNTATEMAQFANANNRGQDFSNSRIELTSDIDFSTIPADAHMQFVSIGTSDRPFTGSFNGRYHTITNLKMEQHWGEAGLFGVVSGDVDISKVRLDSTCVIRTSCYGAGGIVGVTRGNCTLQISQCGFEGYVSGSCNVASMLGAVFESTNHSSDITIDQCYNTGTVAGGTLSAAICGYANDVVRVTDTWNSGTVTGYVSGKPFFRYMGSKTPTYTNCYDVNTQSKITKFDPADLASGRLGYLLNKQVDGAIEWFQRIGIDGRPSLKVMAEGKIYHHTYHECNDMETEFTLYDNNENMDSILHEFDQYGICSRVPGEIHSQAPDNDGTWWDVYNIGNLYSIAQQVNSGATQYNIMLHNNITDNKNVLVDGDLNTSNENLRQWVPIGTLDYPFTHTVKGQGHSISGLYCVNPGSTVGLFGVIQDGAEIRDLVVKDSYFKTYGYCGSIAAIAITHKDKNRSIITRCASQASVNGSMMAGGILGLYYHDEDVNLSSVVTQCYSVGKVTFINPGTSSLAATIGGILGLTATPELQETEGISGVVDKCYYIGDNLIRGTSPYGEAKSELAFRSGEVCQLIADPWCSQPLESSSLPVFNSTGGVTYTRQVKADTWGTIIVPFPVTSDDNVTFYTYGNLDADNTLHLEPAETVEANTPCFFRTAAGCITLNLKAERQSCVTPSTAQVTQAFATTAGADLNVIGSYDQLSVSPATDLANYFVAQNKCWWGEEAFILPAFRSYFTLSNTNQGASRPIAINIEEDGESTQIGEIRDGELKMFDGKYLKNGKVIILKNGVKYNANGLRMK